MLVKKIEKQANLSDLGLFTVWLDRHIKPSEAGNGGLITYGALDNVNCEADIIYTPITSKTYWEFALEGFSVDTYKVVRIFRVFKIMIF
jgi:hypothetical protein